MLVHARVATSVNNAFSMIETALGSGDALERFRQNIELQGGDPKICDKPERLLKKGLTEAPVVADRNGFVSDIGTFAVGRAVSDIGGGRVRAEDSVDHAIAYESVKKIGDSVRRGETLGIIHCRRQSQADLIAAKLREAYKISGVKPGATKLVRAAV